MVEIVASVGTKQPINATVGTSQPIIGSAVKEPSTVNVEITRTGVPGKSAYEIAVDNGFEGTVEEWLLSLQSGDKYFKYDFTVTASVTVQHNLNKLASVSVVDSAGSEIIGSITYLDLNNVKVDFSSAFSGTIICN